MLITSKEIFQLVKDTLSLEQELSTYCRQTKQECHFVSTSTNGIEETICYSEKSGIREPMHICAAKPINLAKPLLENL